MWLSQSLGDQAGNQTQPVGNRVIYKHRLPAAAPQKIGGNEGQQRHDIEIQPDRFKAEIGEHACPEEQGIQRQKSKVCACDPLPVGKKVLKK